MSPLVGYNTNVRHKGKLYHIQTEDSGLQHPHITTHLFADGGRIVASKKTSYAEYVGRENVQQLVKQLMREQHKAMFIALRDGVYDEDEGEGDSTGGDREAQPASGERRAGPQDPERNAPAGQASPSPPLDVDALERAAEQLSQDSAAATVDTDDNDTLVDEDRSGESDPQASGASRRPAPSLKPSRQSGGPTGPGRYQITQPTAARPDPESESIFGSDLVTEKSLDEVILSYLAEDLEDRDD